MKGLIRERNVNNVLEADLTLKTKIKIQGNVKIIELLYKQSANIG